MIVNNVPLFSTIRELSTGCDRLSLSFYHKLINKSCNMKNDQHDGKFNPLGLRLFWRYMHHFMSQLTAQSILKPLKNNLGSSKS